MQGTITHTTAHCLTASEGTSVKVAGRVIFFRKLGGVAFGKIVDQNGSIQFCLRKTDTPDNFKEWRNSVKIGDIVYIDGQIWISNTGEKSVLVTKNFKVLQHSIHPWPNKITGIQDPELKLRKRYLDIATNPNIKQIFLTRSKIIAAIREFMGRHDYIEVETPILQTQASGAQARPFQTHHNAYDADLYLRIAPETYLKRTLAASFDRVFEIGKNFRNEGTDPSHLQEFTSIEWYGAYMDYMDNLDFFRMLLHRLIQTAGYDFIFIANQTDKRTPELIVEYQGTMLDFTNPPVRSYADVFEEYAGISPWELNSAKEIDDLFKVKVRPNLIQPIFLKDYPAHMSPLAQRSSDGRTVEQWQFIVHGWEITKCYTELTDPVLQRQLLEEQMSQREAGDDESMMLEEDFIECLEYGIPPCSGAGMGIGRLVAILTNQTTLRNVVLFPVVL